MYTTRSDLSRAMSGSSSRSQILDRLERRGLSRFVQHTFPDHCAGEPSPASEREVHFMALTIEDVEHVAGLARLGLTDSEKNRLRDQLSAILESMELLNEIDVSNIPPTAQVNSLSNVMRDDLVRPSLTQDQALSNAPRQSEGFFEVDSPLGGSEDVG